MESHVNVTSTETQASMNSAAPMSKSRRSYLKHWDIYRRRLLKERGIDAIDARTIPGRRAKAWLNYALQKKGGKSCPIDLREKIEAGAFYLWRALCLRSFIVTDARKRGGPLNRRYAVLPAVNDQYDTAMSQWQKINDELELDKEMDLARRLMREGKPECRPQSQRATTQGKGPIQAGGKRATAQR